MFRLVRLTRWAVSCATILGLLVLGGLTRPAKATIEFGEDLQLSGNVETQNLIRMPEIDEVQYVQNRNVARIRIDWEMVKRGKFLGQFNVPYIKNAQFYMLYRGAYDGIYDIAPGDRQTGQARHDDLIGGPISGNEIGTIQRGCVPSPNNPNACLREGLYTRFTSHSTSTLKTENVLREIYVDLEFQDIPLSLRIGRQQVIWGEADQFRLMDIWNPTDVTWRFPIADTFDDFRVPLWMIKGIWDFGVVGPFSNAFFEFVYNPFDFQAGQKIGWLPRPWSLPFADPLRDGQMWAFNTPLCKDIDPETGECTEQIDQHVLKTPHFDLQGTSYRKGKFNRNLEDAGEVGFRFHGVSPQGIEGTVSYIYGRGKYVGNSPAFGVKVTQIINNDAQSNRTLGDIIPMGGGVPVRIGDSFVTAEIVHPYVHVFGITGNYFDSEFTNGVLRMEMAYSMGQPFATSQEDKLLEVTDEFGVPIGQTSPVGFMKRDVFAGMFGIDRPTWIRWLNSKGTVFLSSQFFFVHIPGHNVSRLHGFSDAGAQPYFTPNKNDRGIGALYDSGGFGVWSDYAQIANTGTYGANPRAGQVERVQSSHYPPEDNYLPWECMFTFTGATFYRGGTIAPQAVALLDPINLWAMEALELKYFYTNSLVFTLQQRFVFPMKTPMNDPWFVGRFGRRTEFGLKVTYQF